MGNHGSNNSNSSGKYQIRDEDPRYFTSRSHQNGNGTVLNKSTAGSTSNTLDVPGTVSSHNQNHHKLYVKKADRSNSTNGQKISTPNFRSPKFRLNTPKNTPNERQSEILEILNRPINTGTRNAIDEIDRVSLITTSSNITEKSHNMGMPKGSHFWLEKFAKALVDKSSCGYNMISKSSFERYVIPHSTLASNYLWKFFTHFQPENDSINSESFIKTAEFLYSLITDKEVIGFYLKTYGNHEGAITLTGFTDFLLTAYQLSSAEANKVSREINRLENYEGREWVESLTKSCFHLKEEMSICFVSTWLEKNVPRVLTPMHKYIINRLTTGLSYIENPQLEDDYLNTPNLARNVEEIKRMDDILHQEHSLSQIPHQDSYEMDKILFWVLNCSLPSKFLSVLEKRPNLSEPIVRKISPQIISPKQFLQSLMNSHSTMRHQWSILYDSEENGLSENRFTHHVFNYRGPTSMLIRTENSYSFIVGIDTEWKESVNFWGGEDSVVAQLSPEFHILERGSKLIYTNFSIRGYPFGISVGKNPKELTLELAPGFQIVKFKKMPLKVQRIVIWGCAEKDIKSAQSDFKKWEAKECEKRKEVKISNADWVDNPDKYLLELGGAYKSYGN